MATITDKASIISAFTEFYAKMSALITAAKNDAVSEAVSEIDGKGYQSYTAVQIAIKNALAAYGNGDTEEF